MKIMPQDWRREGSLRRSARTVSFCSRPSVAALAKKRCFRSGNSTRDSIPPHVIVGDAVDGESAEFYARLCPAGVYERVDGGLKVNAPNCVDCKATDVLGPRWTPREGGSGPRYKRM